MTRRDVVLGALAMVATCLVGLQIVPGSPAATPGALPVRLSDDEFWTLTSDFSESNGTFRSDNLVSNEAGFQYVIPDLLRKAIPGRIYMGVGPEQNFTYIAAVKPAMAFIIDVRRGNRDLHLMYKAIFELSATRAEFVSRLFSRKQPAGLDSHATASDLFTAFAPLEATPDTFEANLKAIVHHLTVTHEFPLSEDELGNVEEVYRAFVRFGPDLQYSSTGSFGGRFGRSYADLMTATDQQGEARGYLANEAAFAFVKDLESRNMLVPIVGNFAGPKAIRAVGTYLKERGATVSAFYLSNVEQFLEQDGIWGEFCASVATLPLDERSSFIRSVRGGGYGWGRGLNSKLGEMAAEVRDCQTSAR